MRYPIADRQLNEAIVAVTGASVDADETPTLVTRHSLREQRKGATILLVDPNRDSQILAAHILGRHDCSVVAAQDLGEATRRARPGHLRHRARRHDASRASRATTRRSCCARASRATPTRRVFVAASLEHSPRYREAKIEIGFNATLAKPFRKDDLWPCSPRFPGARPAASRPLKAGLSVGRDAHAMRLLLVEDDAMIGAAAREGLRQEGPDQILS